jgi:hypothetical protein
MNFRSRPTHAQAETAVLDKIHSLALITNAQPATTMVSQTIYSRYVSKEGLKNLLSSLFQEGTFEWEVKLATYVKVKRY